MGRPPGAPEGRRPVPDERAQPRPSDHHMDLSSLIDNEHCVNYPDYSTDFASLIEFPQASRVIFKVDRRNA